MTNPIPSVLDRILDEQEQRHSWICGAAAQIRKWREEDARNGQPWGEDHEEQDHGN